MPLTLNGSGGITYPDGTVNTTRSVSAAGDTMTGQLSVPSITGLNAGVAANLLVGSNLVIGNSLDINPSTNSAGQLKIEGNGYVGFITLNATAMYIGHNSTQRQTTLMVNETSRLTCDVNGNVSLGDGSIRDGYIALGVGESSLLWGGVGARTTAGTTNWNDISNAHSGSGFTLLLGNHSNGPGPANYFHSWCFEYSEKNGNGNMTQWAIGYNSNERYQRTRYSDVWSSWSAF
jgi:hypothetical protein